MQPLLLKEALRRHRGALGFGALVSATLWVATMTGSLPLPTAFAGSMAIATVAGPILSLILFANRELLLLPVSRRQIWRTRWTISVPITVIVMLAGKLGGLLLTQSWSLSAVETALLSSVLDAAYAGAVIGILPAVQGARLHSLKLPHRITGPPVVTLSIAAFLFSPFLPFAMRNQLPTFWGGLTSSGIIGLGVALTLTLLAYFITPRAVAHPSPTATRAALKPRGRSRWPILAKVTGLSRLTMKIWMSTAVAQAVAPVAIITVMYVLNSVTGDTENWQTIAEDFGLLPFISGANPFSWMVLAIFGSIATEIFGGSLRSLRTLPMSTNRLNGVLLVVPMVGWLNAWIIFAILHLAIMDQPIASWQAPLLFGYVGIDSLFRSVQLRWWGKRVTFGYTILIFTIVALISTRQTWLSTDALFILAGLLGLSIAAALNHHTLTRRRTAYARHTRTWFGQELQA